MPEKFYRLETITGEGLWKGSPFLDPEGYEYELKQEIGDRLPSPNCEKNWKEFKNDPDNKFYFTEKGYQRFHNEITALSCYPELKFKIEELPGTHPAITFRGASGLQVCINQKFLKKKYSKKGGNNAAA